MSFIVLSFTERAGMEKFLSLNNMSFMTLCQARLSIIDLP